MSRYFSTRYLRAQAALRTTMVDRDAPCGQCGYNLRGLRTGGACPECGAPIRLHDAARDALWDAPLALIRRFQGGLWLGVAAALCLLVVPLAAIFVMGSGRGALMVLPFAGIAWLAATWLMTPAMAIEGGVRRGFSERGRLRRAARWLQLGWPVAGVIIAIGGLVPGVPAPVVFAVMVIALLAAMAGLVLLALLLRGLAEWLNDDTALRLLDWVILGLIFCPLAMAALVVVPLRIFMFTVALWWIASFFLYFVVLCMLANATGQAHGYALRKWRKMAEERAKIQAAWERGAESRK